LTHSISDAFSHIFNGVCEASYRPSFTALTPVAFAAFVAFVAFMAFATVMAIMAVMALGRGGGVYGCIRICRACGYGDRGHSN